MSRRQEAEAASAMTRRPRPETCQNCGSTRVAEYCADCGQRNLDVQVPASELLRDAIEDGLSLDSRMGRTVLPFLFRPGFLVTEWTAGRRARYSSPLRLFLLTSFMFFVAHGTGLGPDPFRMDADPGGAAATAGGAATAGQAAAGETPGEREEGAADARSILGDDPDAKDGPPGIVIGPGQPVPTGTKEQHEKLRAQGWLARKLDDRWRSFEAMTQREAISRVKAAFREWVPRVTFFLVPAAVIILLLLWPRRWLSEHVVLSLHLHALAFTVFTLLLFVQLLPEGGPRNGLSVLLWLAIPAWFLTALRRVFGQRWRWTVLKGATAALLYLVALAIGMAGVAVLAVWFA